MILDVKKNIFFGILLSLITFLFIFIPGFKVKAEDDYVLKPTDILISSDDLKSVSGDAIKGNLTYADIQEIMSNNPDYDFVNEYKYFVILLKHWDRSNINGNVLEIMFFDKQPLISDTIIVTNEMNRLTYTVGKINSNFIIDFDNLDLTQSLEYESLYRSSTDISKEFANGVYYLAFDNLNPSSYIKPKSYTFNEDIDVTNISKVKVKFDLPSDTKNLNLSLNYSITGMNIFGTIGQPYIALKSINEDGKEQTDISNTDRVDYDTLVANACVIADCEQYKDWKTNPFEEMLDGITEDKVNNFLNSHVTDISKWDSFREITNKIINRQYNYANHYVDDFNMSLLPDSTVNGYSLEFDTFNYNGSLHLNFTSNLNYTIEYEYMSDNEDYFTTINMKDYAALIMIPKVYDRNNEIQSSISSDIYLSGKYDIELWESIESKNVLYRKSNYEDIVFSHYQHRLYPNAVLYFIKKPVDNSTMDLYIKFDSRYYSYVTKTNLAEEVVINNPNTGEDVTIGDISNLFDSNLENDDFSILDYLDDIRDTADYFDYYFNKGWKLLPFRIRAIILFIFNIMCVAIVLKIGGYKK